MREELKQNKAITLIALVITIIVLLILAGITIAMLSGENGILSRAQQTRGTNAYTQAEEQARLAYMAVKTEIMSKKASNGTYDPRDSENAEALKQIVANDLTGNGWQAPDLSSNKITVIYNNASIKAGDISSGIPAHDGYVGFEIELTENDAIFSADGVVGGSSTGNAGTGGGSQTGGSSSGTSGSTTGSTTTIIAARGTPEVPEAIGTLAANYVDTMKGKYVKYGAGVWGSNSDAIMKQLGKNGAKYENYSGTDAPNQQGQFGGFQQDTWVATGVSSSDENGQYYVGTTPAWQICGKDSNGCVQIMSTYITEEYYHKSGQSSASEALLQGNGDRGFSVYENTLLAVAGSAHAMTKAEADALSQNQRKATTLSGMAGMSSANYYWLGTAHDSNNMYDVNSNGSLTSYGINACYGVRPVVSLKSDILYSGSGTAAAPYVVGYSE